MTLDETTDLLTPVALAMRVQLDVPTFIAYHAMLGSIPIDVAVAGLELWRQSGPRFFPSAPEIQSWSEKARRHQLAALPWRPCASCELQPGWQMVFDGDMPRLTRCQCKVDHQAMLSARGLLEAITVLPNEAEAGDESVYPRFEQLPAKLQRELRPLIKQKVLR